MCDVSMKDRKTSEELKKLVQSITTVIRNGRLRWYGHAMKTGDKDMVRDCISGYGRTCYRQRRCP